MDQVSCTGVHLFITPFQKNRYRLREQILREIAHHMGDGFIGEIPWSRDSVNRCQWLWTHTSIAWAAFTIASQYSTFCCSATSIIIHASSATLAQGQQASVGVRGD